MIAIDDILVSDEVIEKHFVCDLNACKGGCCIDGDCGAPLTEAETKILEEIFPKIKHLLPESYVAEIKRQGTHTWDDEYGYVTPAINGGICAYGYFDELGIAKCGIEKAYNEGLIDFKKPVSCHLYPIRISESENFTAVNYEPRKKLCKPACKLGNQLKVPVFQFLKEPLIRRFGHPFYEALEAVAAEYFPPA
ncbi:MAG: DUF3109 family protein [Bacteroidetes bacterium]|nr:DUF3109 family protein [Bacteroidota bacterium]MBS1739373.1 DUF3109 family protein [Bacteroidota bacterium]